MSKPNYPPEFETQVRQAMEVSEPKPETLDALRKQFIARGTSSLKTDLQPDPAPNPFRPEKESNKMNRKPFRFSPRLAWSVALLILASLLVIAFSSPKVVTALRRLLGYVPGVGVVEQSPSLRMLAEPVTVTRESVTLTIDQAVLTNEKTVVVYSYVTPLYNSDEGFFMDGPMGIPALVLPDGTRLEIVIGRQVSTMDCSECGDIRYAMEFPPIPADVQEAILEIPNLVGLQNGLTPLNWVIDLKFAPADPSTIIPVIEYQPTATPVSATSVSTTQTPETYGAILVLDKSASLPDGYILYGTITWTDPIIPQYGLSATLAGIKDANGNDIPFEYADAEAYPQQGELREYWAYKIPQLDFAAPLTLSFAVNAWTPLTDAPSFTFDPGPNPQLGQKWEINQDVVVKDEIVHVLSAEQAGIEEGFFMFTMQSDSNIVGASITDLQHPPMGGGGGGGGVPVVKLPFFVGFGYQTPIPTGPLTLTFQSVNVLLQGDWSVTWSPAAP
ncbi:MAG TPA: hypothetical protein PKM54_09580 [Anaerolineales bacterium]|nr:hypothetical protein [Anaerolineales bacterium]